MNLAVWAIVGPVVCTLCAEATETCADAATSSTDCTLAWETVGELSFAAERKAHSKRRDSLARGEPLKDPTNPEPPSPTQAVSAESAIARSGGSTTKVWQLRARVVGVCCCLCESLTRRAPVSKTASPDQ